MGSGETQPSITLVMPAHRAGPDLDASVASVDALDPAPDEFVIVVDGADAAVVDRLAPTHVTIPIPRSGPAVARNRGAAATDGDIVLFVDSDIVVPSDLVARVRAEMETPGARGRRDAVFGSYDDSPAAPETVSQFRNLLHHWTHRQNAGPAHTFWSGCGAIRREAFDAVEGFDERFSDASIEDIDLGERMCEAGYTIEIVPSIEVKHLKRWTLWGMIVTDFAKRGVPWTRLMLGRRSVGNDLNTTKAARVDVGLSAMLAVALVAVVGRPGSRARSLLVASALAMTLVWRDRGFLDHIRRRRTLGLALRSVPLLFVHRLTAGCAFAWAVVTWPWNDGTPR